MRNKLGSQVLKCIVSLAGAVLCTTPAAAADDRPWPSERPIRMMVGMPAGYSPDVVRRQLAEGLARQLRQSIVVENRPGPGGAVMLRTLRSAAPDGYTIASVAWNQMSAAPALFKDLGYDTITDFTPIGIWMDGTHVLVAHPGSGITNVAELRDRAMKANPPLQYGSMGVAAPSHLLTSVMMENGAFSMVHVPFSGQRAVFAVVNGDVPVGMMGVADALPMIRDRRLMPLAVTGERRVPALAGTPTITQAGIPGLHHRVWIGIAAPRGMPVAIVERLHRAIKVVVSDPDFRSRFEDVGRLVDAGTPDEMLAAIREEVPFWREMVKRVGISAQ